MPTPGHPDPERARQRIPGQPDVRGSLVLVQTNYAMALSNVGRRWRKRINVLLARPETAGEERLGRYPSGVARDRSSRRARYLAKALGMLGSTLLRAGRSRKRRDRFALPPRSLRSLRQRLPRYLAKHDLEHGSASPDWYMEAGVTPQALRPMRALALARRISDRRPRVASFSWNAQLDVWRSTSTATGTSAIRASRAMARGQGSNVLLLRLRSSSPIGTTPGKGDLRTASVGPRVMSNRARMSPGWAGEGRQGRSSNPGLSPSKNKESSTPRPGHSGARKRRSLIGDCAVACRLRGPASSAGSRKKSSAAGETLSD